MKKGHRLNKNQVIDSDGIRETFEEIKKMNINRQIIIEKINNKYGRSRNFIYPDMSERKFKQPKQDLNGVRLWVVVAVLTAFLILSYFL